MTPEEAIKIAIHCLGVQAEQEVCEECDIYGNCHTDCKDAAVVAIKALEEIQQYREIGTVEECKSLASISSMLEKCELKKIIDEWLKYTKIGTVEECREAREKQKAIKPKEMLRHRGGFEIQHCPNCETDYQVDRRYTITDEYCPVCGKLLDSAFRNYCANCGQAIAENLEGMEDEKD